MRIEVTGSPPAYVDCMRAYAEYRVFSRLAMFVSQVSTIEVVLSRSADDGPTSCLMSAELTQGGRILARSRSRQPTGAVDAAAGRLAAAAKARLSPP